MLFDDLSLQQSALELAAQTALNIAKEKGATDSAVSFSLDAGVSVTARERSLENIEFQRDRGLGITVYVGQRRGSASTADIGDTAIRQAVQAAIDIASYTAEDEASGLPEQGLLATEFRDFDLYHPSDATIDDLIQQALAMEGSAFGADKKITASEGASVYSSVGLRHFANSRGFAHSAMGSNQSLSLAVIAEQAGRMERDYWYESARAVSDLPACEAVGIKAAERTVRRLGAQTLSTRECPVVFEPTVARSVFGHFLGAIKGGAIYRGSSYLLDRVNSRVMAANMNLIEQPHLQRAASSASYDSEGVCTKEQAIVAGGVLQHYLLGCYSARRLGLQTTGNAGGARNVLVQPTCDKGLQELLREMGTGLLVTELMGQGVNITAGDYSRGATGFWVENGELAYPVNEITIAGKLDQMYQGIVAAGSDLDIRGNLRAGSLWLDRMTVAGA